MKHFQNLLCCGRRGSHSSSSDSNKSRAVPYSISLGHSPTARQIPSRSEAETNFTSNKSSPLFSSIHVKDSTVSRELLELGTRTNTTGNIPSRLFAASEQATAEKDETVQERSLSPDPID